VRIVRENPTWGQGRVADEFSLCSAFLYRPVGQVKIALSRRDLAQMTSSRGPKNKTIHDQAAAALQSGLLELLAVNWSPKV
jgi:hypothetical protein